MPIHPNNTHWSVEAAARVRTAFPDADPYVLAAGISPSGPVHVGNFRDVITTAFTAQVLALQGHAVRSLFFWDDFDRFRSVPAGVPDAFAEHLGKPLAEVPDPHGAYASYAERFETRFEDELARMGIQMETVRQYDAYKAGTYDALVLHALEHRLQLADLLARFKTQPMSAEERAAFYPISIYSRFTGKDRTQILAYDGAGRVTYRCEETGKQDEVDLTTDRIAKLKWRVDWPMRWTAWNVHFEPGGKDHGTPGGSFDVGQVLVRDVFGRAAPVFQAYEFIGIRGSSQKMSGSQGNVFTLTDMLDIYEPQVLKWLFARTRPEQAFDLALDDEAIRQYAEYDKEVAQAQEGSLSETRVFTLHLSHVSPEDAPYQNPLPFRQATGDGLLVQFDPARAEDLQRLLGQDFDVRSIRARLPRAGAWLEKHNPDKLFVLLPAPNPAFFHGLPEEDQQEILALHAFLAAGPHDGEEIQTVLYEIPKLPEASNRENKRRQRRFFSNVYTLLFGTDQGPRLATFLTATEAQEILPLLAFEELASR